MRPFAIIVAAAAAAILAAPAHPQAWADENDPYFHRTSDLDLPAPVWVTQITRARANVWRCQKQAGLPLSPAGLTAADLRRAGLPFRGWVLDRWQGRGERCRSVLDRTIPDTGDWLTAVRHVQRAFPGSEGWLVSCSSSEGGHGPWIWYGRYSTPVYGEWDTPGGPMQYKQGTFWHDFNRATSAMRDQGLRWPPSAASYYSLLGQAIAAGWAYHHNRPSGKWTGYRC